MKQRGSGILLPVFSLPSPYGIGTLGKEAYEFVDFLYDAKQKYWQILPVGPTSYGDSPYQSYSVNAGNPYMIDLDILVKEGLLKEEELPDREPSEAVNYEMLYQTRFTLLWTAFTRFDSREQEYLDFIKEEDSWLPDYALFMSLKEAHLGACWNDWEVELRDRDADALGQAKASFGNDVRFWMFLQYKFYQQWKALRTYAGKKGIKIIGDIPIYVAYDSVDVWAASEYYELDENRRPVNVAGCPPDGFSPTGQVWGNPLYNWDLMKEEGYQWWIRRLSGAAKLYDVIRIDHFRGFESYFSIPAGQETAENGIWRKGPGMELFRAVQKVMGEQEFIAEDLGFVTPEVAQLLKDSGYPGMKLLQFAFDSREAGDYYPHNYERNSVGYLGTHDNDTTLGWAQGLTYGDFCKMLSYLNLETDRDYVWHLIKALMGTVCNTVIVSMQDYLCLGSAARINTPSTTGKNWQWRMKEDACTKELAKKIAAAVELYQR